MENNTVPNPERFFPLTPVAYVVYGLLFLIPGIGLICAALLSFLAKNVNLRLYSRSWLMWYAIIVLVIAAFAVVLYSRGKLFRFLRNIPKAYKVLFP